MWAVDVRVHTATQWEAPIDEMVALLEEQQRAEMEAMLEEV
jgi:hypothetical protein